MNFTDAGTLKEWKEDDSIIIPTIHETKPGTQRGGAFLCLPNFEELPAPFEIKHGEYRREHCNVTLPHQKILESSTPEGWGSLSTSTTWKETFTNDTKVLTVETTLGALSEKVYLRPGFHPYFAVGDTFSVHVEDTTYDKTSLPSDSMKVVRCKTGTTTGIARLLTKDKEIMVSCSVAQALPEEGFCFSFCVWTDNKNEYVCVEPVIGGVHLDNNLPIPFTLLKSKELTLVFEIQVKTLR